MVERRLSLISLPPLVWWPEPDVWYCTGVIISVRSAQSNNVVRTRQHRDDGQNLITTPELRAGDKHLGHLY